MRSKLVPIGNSRGIRIPKAMLEQAGLTDQVDLKVFNGRVIVSSINNPRAGWEAAFRIMRKRGHDRLLDARSILKPSEWEQGEWTW